ncbi:MAG: 5-formyltetrahydrofolate cyclo-ligase [Eubacteriales bacterium]|nr:5-formyltetrahydrofolate cyclo-ligase [Eubacteriales bacterium]
MQTKARLRRELLRQRRQMPLAEKQRMECAITQKLLHMDRFVEAQTVFVYYSTDEEISTRDILTACWEQGKTVCLPKCLPGHRMAAREVRALHDLTEQTYGIPEPGAHCVAIPPEQLDLCIVPALACDRAGYRLGYGGGFYDRFLLRTRGTTVALCAAKRLFDRLPVEEFDIPCQCIITENEVWNL